MTQRIDGPAFSTEQQQAFERLLREEGIDVSPEQRIPRRTSDDYLPLSFAQQRLWFLDQLEPGSSAYNMTKAARLTGPLNIAALETALSELVQRHETLRTTFAAHNGEPRQIIAPAAKIQLAVTDLSQYTAAEQDELLEQLLRAEVERPFDLSRGPLFHAGLWRLGEQEHVFYMDMHHIVSDGWSMTLLFRELSALYGAALHGRAARLAELPIQYADYALWQREWLQGERLEEQLEYWRQQLAGAPAVLELPGDYARPAQQSYHGCTHRLTFDTELVRRVKQFTRESGCTVFMTMLAVFKVLLHRYTGQGDIVVGSPIAGRDRGELDGLIGFFVNTLVLRTELTGNPSFKELLERVREVCLGAYAHQDLPFEKLVEELQPERSLTHSPLFQIAISLQNTDRAELAFEGLQEKQMEFARETAKFDLTFSVWEGPQGMLSGFQYNSDLFEPATIERLAEHYCRLLESAISQPDQKIADLKMLTTAEERQLLIDWNATQLDQSPTECIHELFEKQVAKTPEATAIVSETESLTYLELNKRANRMAHYLKSLGVGPEELVGVCLERSPDLVAALLGVMKAGGAYVPIDPAYPRARLAFMLEDAKIRVLITEEGLLHLSQNLDVTRVSVDGDRSRLAEMSDQNPPNVTLPDNRAYIIYTSGSTGRAKGIEITHRSVATLFEWVRRFYTPEEMEGVLTSTSICFDISVFEMFGTLTQGGKCILAKNALALAELSCANQVTLLDAVPSAVAELVRINGIPPSVRMVNLPGEPLSATLVEQVFERKTVERAVNLYGPSEDTTFSTYALLTREDKLPPPIGRPVSNTQIYILDKHFQVCPTRVPGELYISGDGLSRGYLNRAEQTAERYLPSPFGPPGSRMYKTGDLARYRWDGNLEYLGRIDHQVKVRGFRIELGEIEAALREHEQITDAIVVAREDATGSKQLVAYVVMSAEAFSVRDLRNYIKDRLPEYMIPSAFVRLDSLPHLPNGKVDRLSLPDPDGGSASSEETYEAPQTPVEQVLASLWAGLLKVNRVGLSDNFFELGGHSLLGVQLISRIRELLLVELPLLTLFEAPTISLLASAIIAREAQAGRTEKIARIVLRVQQTQGGEAGASD
jgi:amino acid adenylation domain-containing protein